MIICPNRGGDITENKIICYGLLRILRTFIMEITVLLQGNLFTLKRLSQIGPKTLLLGEIGQKPGPFYYGYYVNYGP
jgi:hypothetical protein